MQRALVEAIWKRAKSRCEYCLMDARLAAGAFEIDHVIAQRHGGATELPNLALSCFRCNCCKGPCVAGVDPDSGRVTRLFNPRRDRWKVHFTWDGPRLVGQTAIGRTTVEMLMMNDPRAVRTREILVAAGVFPPET